MRVDIYWNLHKNVWSIRHKGRVIQHATHALVQDATFVVQEGGRQRVLREMKKNVHAFVRGTLVWSTDSTEDRLHPGQAVSYNPYKGPSFFRKDTGEDIKEAKFAYLGEKTVLV